MFMEGLPASLCGGLVHQSLWMVYQPFTSLWLVGWLAGWLAGGLNTAHSYMACFCFFIGMLNRSLPNQVLQLHRAGNAVGITYIWYADILEIIYLMRIPSIEKCYQLMSEMGMLEHIVAHSVQVCRVASLLVDYLGEQGIALNSRLIQASALLHDITKTKSIETGENHALTGKQVLMDMGYPDVGIIVGQHVVLDEYFSSDTPVEEEIVNYADKRVLHNKVTNIEERLKYVMERYGKDPERRQRILTLWDKTKRLEDRLFSFLPFSPEELDELLESYDCIPFLFQEQSGK